MSRGRLFPATAAVPDKAPLASAASAPAATTIDVGSAGDVALLPSIDSSLPSTDKASVAFAVNPSEGECGSKRIDAAEDSCRRFPLGVEEGDALLLSYLNGEGEGRPDEMRSS